MPSSQGAVASSAALSNRSTAMPTSDIPARRQAMTPAVETTELLREYYEAPFYILSAEDPDADDEEPRHRSTHAVATPAQDGNQETANPAGGRTETLSARRGKGTIRLPAQPTPSRPRPGRSSLL